MKVTGRMRRTAIAVGLLLAAAPVFAVVSGRLVTAPDGTSAAEEVLLDQDLVRSLLAVRPEEPVWLRDWPLAPGVRRDVLLARHEVYADGARLFQIVGDDPVELPRSGWVFLWGQVDGDEDGTVVVSIDPETGTLQGHAETGDGWSEVRPIAGREEYRVAPLLEPLPFECGGPTRWAVGPELLGRPRSGQQARAIDTLHRVTLAVDTDNELLLLKFADNTTSASNYIASLIALMSAVYERDLRIRLLQGTTFLRVSTTPDPYNVSDTGGASGAKLSEFRTYWSNNYGSIQRAAAVMLSGKQASANSASGIAYLDSLCSFGSGYSFSQVFKFNGSTASNDVKLVAHEIGHNFGSDHTHCYLDPTPIDTCYSGEGGCYSGSTGCPAPMTINGVPNVRGTLMSYCHILNGCSSASVFHPRTVELLDPIVESKVGECVFPLATPQEASDLLANRGSGTSVNVTYTPGCGATNHTVYAGSLATLQQGGLSWSQRHCSLGTSGSLTFNPGSTSVYFVVVANDGSREGSYGTGASGERPPAGSGPGCQYTQELSGTCP